MSQPEYTIILTFGNVAPGSSNHLSIDDPAAWILAGQGVEIEGTTDATPPISQLQVQAADIWLTIGGTDDGGLKLIVTATTSGTEIRGVAALGIGTDLSYQVSGGGQGNISSGPFTISLQA